MAQIAYILLCHMDPDAIVAQARRLTAAGDAVAIRFDRRAPDRTYREIVAALQDNPRVAFAARRTLLHALGRLHADHVARYIRASLAEGDCDYIEAHHLFASDWIRTGLKEERPIYRHYVNTSGGRRLAPADPSRRSRRGARRAGGCRRSHLDRMGETAAPLANAAAIARFLTLEPAAARTIAETPHLFND